MFPVVTLAAVYLATNIASAATVPHYEKVYYDLENADNLYKEYLKLHNKRYNAEEYGKRLEIFKQALEDINAKNEIYPQTVFGPTVLSDLTPEERNSRRGFLAFNNTGAVSLYLDPDMVYEDHLDWRERGVVAPVKDQGQCQSCFIFSAIANIEGQYAMKHQECLVLSEQQALDCVVRNYCAAGFVHEVMNGLAGDAAALELESDYPYTGAQGQCTEDASKKRVTVQGGQVLSVADEDTLKQYLTQYGPLSIAIDDTDMNGYKNGIMPPHACGSTANHAMLLVGYGEEAGSPYWIIKNSWGPSFGEQGYLRMQRGVRACGIASYVATATVA